MVEITVIVKDEEKTFRMKFLVYPETEGEISLSRSCPRLQKMVETTLSNFIGKPETVIVKANYVW